MKCSFQRIKKKTFNEEKNLNDEAEIRQNFRYYLR